MKLFDEGLYCGRCGECDNPILKTVIEEYDDRIRPNQIWAVALPFSILDDEKEKKVVVEETTEVTE